MGGAVFPPCCLGWGQTMVVEVKVMATSFKRTCAHTVVFSAPDPAAGHCWLMPPLETPGHSQASLAQSLMETLLFCSFLLVPGVHKVLFVPSKSLFPQSCGSSTELWLQSNPTGLQSQIPWGFSVPLLDPQVGKSVVALELSTVWENLCYNCYAVCG